MTQETLYILDVSGYLFRAYFALPPMTNPRGESTHALFGFIRSLLKLLKERAPEQIVAVFDGPDNKQQRREIYEKYKAHRVRLSDDLPSQMELAKRFCELIGVTHIEIAGVEADDTMGSIAKWAASYGMTVYLCTGDKDLCQLVGDQIFILNPWKNNLLVDAAKVKEIYGVPPDAMVDFLALVGDSSDNIPGLKGCGPKTAVLLLEQFGSLEALLAHPEQIKGEKKQQMVREGQEAVRLSQRLATINTQLEFPQEPEMFKRKPVEEEKLREFYLTMGFHSLLLEAAQADKEPPHLLKQASLSLHVIDNLSSFHQFLRLLQGVEEAVCYPETTSETLSSLELMGLAFCLKEAEAFYLPLPPPFSSQEELLKELQPVLKGVRVIAHNAKWLLHLFHFIGISIGQLGCDTLLLFSLLHAGSRLHTLEQLSLHYLGSVPRSVKELLGSGKQQRTLSQIPLIERAHSCGGRAETILRLKEQLMDALKKKPSLEKLLIEVELPLTQVLARMEAVGVYVDLEKLHSLSQETTKELNSLEQAIYELAGESFNINSPKQLSKILFEKLAIKSVKKTATGLSTRAEVLELLAKEHPIAECLLQFRLLEKLRSTYIDSLPLTIDPQSGRIHPTFNQFIAATGRLACQEPNLQNIPTRSERGKKIREAFRPEQPGWVYLAADYSQIELRLLAHFSEDKQLLAAFESGEDIHAFTASLIFGVPLNEVSRVQRERAKAINFGIIYGQQAYGLSQALGIALIEAAAFIEAYFARYPQVLEFVRHSIEVVRKEGHATTLLGREREIPEIHSRNAQLRMAAERLAINTPLQGSAADLIKLAMLSLDQELSKGWEAKMVLQIHDELLFELPEREIEPLSLLVKERMEGVIALKAPLLVDIIIGKNWAEC